MAKKLTKFILDIAESEKEYFDRVLARENPVKVKSNILKMLEEKGTGLYEIREFEQNICDAIEKANYTINKAAERYKGAGQGYRADLGRISYSGKNGTPIILKESSFLRAIFPKGICINDKENAFVYPQKIKLYPFAVGFFISPHTKEEIKLFEGKNGFVNSMPEYFEILYDKQRKEVHKKINLFMKGKGSFPHEESGEYLKSDLEKCLGKVDKNLDSGVKSPRLMGLQPLTFFVNTNSEDRLLQALFGDEGNQLRVDRTENHELKHIIDKFLQCPQFRIEQEFEKDPEFDLYDLSGWGKFDCAELSARLYSGQALKVSSDTSKYEERIKHIEGLSNPSNPNTGKIILLENKIKDIKEAYDRAIELKNRLDPRILSYIVGFSRTAEKVNQNLRLLEEI